MRRAAQHPSAGIRQLHLRHSSKRCISCVNNPYFIQRGFLQHSIQENVNRLETNRACPPPNGALIHGQNPWPIMGKNCSQSTRLDGLSGFRCHPRCRSMSTWLPEALQSFSMWGGSGFCLKALHLHAAMPYWACFGAMSVLVRVGLFPLVLYGAHTSARFAKVVPEVQFLLSLFQNDMKHLREQKAPMTQKWMLMRMNLRTLGALYKLHRINPLSVFLSPLMQLPIFWYVSVDLRKIVNGLDPALAQQLVDSPIMWIPDLTEPDPWYGLPILAGLVMYWNVEVAVGKRSLSGANAAKSDTGVLVKDIFQSFAVLMPCFSAQLPAGIQVYLVTSFLFTVAQSAALRTEHFRQVVGLPPMLTAPPEAKYAQEFLELKKLEQKAREARGGGPVLGKGVLAVNLEVSFAGRYRPSTIQGSGKLLGNALASANESPSLKVTVPALPPGPFVHGVSAPPWQLLEQEEQASQEGETASGTYGFSGTSMTNADRGVFSTAPLFINEVSSKNSQELSIKRLKKIKVKKKSRR